jgi:hypothetical protein
MTNRAKLLLLELSAFAIVAALCTRPVSNDPIDRQDPAGWLRAAQPETVVAELGRFIAVALAAYLLLSLTVAIAAHRSPRLEGVGRLAPRTVRRLVEGAFAAGVIGVSLAPGVAAASDRSRFAPLSAVRDGRAAMTAVAAVAPEPLTPALPDPAHPGPQPGPAQPVPAQTSPSPRGARHVVVPGESLWSIARDEATAAGLVDGAAIERYWRVLCDVNRATLPSGDLDVVHPGDEVILPADDS